MHALSMVGINVREAAHTPAGAPLFPQRPATASDPRSLTAVYRAVQVLTTAASQLPLIVERGGKIVSPTPSPVSFLDPRMTRGTWINHMVTALALHGNAYALIERDASGKIAALRPLDPARVFVSQNEATHALIFSVEGKTLTSADVLHAHLQPARVGEPLGLGPIQAARLDLAGSMQVRDYAAQWFDGTGEPTGILTAPANGGTFEKAMAARDAWNGFNPDGSHADQSRNPARIKVLPSGFTYQSLGLSPRDAQYLEVQEFNILQVARLFGIPSTLILASPSGGSMTYSNVEQDWINFTRFTLMNYLRPLEEALSAVTANGQTVRFNIEGMLRSDTKTRYESYALALSHGFLTVDEIRALEGRQPLNGNPL